MPRARKHYDDKLLSALLKNVCRKLTVFREEAKLSQNELARHSGVALSTINELENEVATDIRFSTVTALARALERKPIEFMTDSDLNVTDLDQRELEKAYQILRKLHLKFQ